MISNGQICLREKLFVQHDFVSLGFPWVVKVLAKQ